MSDAELGSSKHCCVPGCSSNSRTSERKRHEEKRKRNENYVKMSFHRFTKDKTLKKIWIHKIRRDTGKYFQINDETRICGKHFKPEEIRETPSGRSFLAYNAIPSIFPWAKDLPSKKRYSRLELIEASVPSEDVNGEFESEIPLTEAASHESFQERNPFADHNYCSEEPDLKTRLKTVEAKVEFLTTQLVKLSLTSFGSERYKNDNETFRYYTGFSSYAPFQKFFCLISSDASKIPLWSSVQKSVAKGQRSNFGKFGAQRTLPLADELFLFLVRLRQGFDEKDLSERFGISVPAVRS